jgi:hypothetical protein
MEVEDINSDNLSIDEKVRKVCTDGYVRIGKKFVRGEIKSGQKPDCSCCDFPTCEVL